MEDQQDQAAPGLQADTDKIDMSLDDIIYLRTEEAGTQSASNQLGQRGKVRSANFRTMRFFRGASKNQQGPNRRKFGFRQQGYSGVNLRNSRFGPGARRRSASLNGISPLNRQDSNQQSTRNGAAFVNSTYGGKSQIQRRRQQQQQRYRQAATPFQVLTRSRMNAQNRRPPFNPAQRQQRINAFNQNRRLTQRIAMNPGKSPANERRWQTEGGFGSTLTVSVPNPKASQIKTPTTPAMKRPGLRFRKMAARSSDPPPKGVPLRFNFRAMANHTNVMLNERFSTLEIKGQFTAARRGGRTVTLA
ncbi:UAP56-interacting factor-like isoform X1 [Ascaphus truei]|uniref:UAP56-interacting factor-like isoform X1 n=1 Tax=Ascaphus truei TaxID=8439 RepID=UPI003F5927DD